MPTNSEKEIKVALRNQPQVSFQTPVPPPVARLPLPLDHGCPKAPQQEEIRPQHQAIYRRSRGRLCTGFAQNSPESLQRMHAGRVGVYRAAACIMGI
eukprot:1326806-Amorphochlora_amoeboformis.AAC.2